MSSKSEQPSLLEARDRLRATYFPVADDAGDDEFNAAIDRADDAIRFGIMSGQVSWWYVPAGGIWPRPGVDASELREPTGADIARGELRLTTNRDGTVDSDRILIQHEPADFTQVTIDWPALETFVRNLPVEPIEQIGFLTAE